MCFCFLGQVSIAPNHPRYSPGHIESLIPPVFVYLCFVRQVSIALITDIPELTHWVIDTISIATHSMSFIHWTFNLRKEIVVYVVVGSFLFVINIWSFLFVINIYGVFCLWWTYMELEMKHWWWRTGTRSSATAAILWLLYSYMRWPWCYNVILTMMRQYIFKWAWSHCWFHNCLRFP